MLNELNTVKEIHTYDLGNGFVLEVQNVCSDSESTWEAYLFHRMYSIKAFVLGTDDSEDLEEFLDDVEMMLNDPDVTETFLEEYFRYIHAIEESNEKQFDLEW